MHKVWFNVQNLAGIKFTNIQGLDSQNFAPITSGLGLFQAISVDGQNLGGGGVLLSGAGVANFVSLYGTACQELITSGVGADGGTGWNSNLGYNGVAKLALEVPGVWRGNMMPVDDSYLSSHGIPLGTIFEGVNAISDILLAGQRAGQASAGTAYVQGVSVGAYGSCTAMNGLNIPVATGGVQVPVQVGSGPLQVGTLLKPSTSTYGQATTESTIDSLNLGVINYSANSGNSALNYMMMRPLQ
jgi:hypothetical protein